MTLEEVKKKLALGGVWQVPPKLSTLRRWWLITKMLLRQPRLSAFKIVWDVWRDEWVRQKILVSADVSMRELENLHSVASLEEALALLRHKWVGEYPDREYDVRAGTVYVYCSDDGTLHFDFASRIKLSEEEKKELREAGTDKWR